MALGSRPIDDVVVRMKMENDDFLNKAKKSLQTFDDLTKKMEGSKTVDMSKIADGVENISNKFTLLGSLARNTFDRISNMAIDAGIKLAKAFVLDPIAQGWQEYQLKMDSMKTIMSSTGESITTVKKYLEELNKYSDDTIYSFSDMTSNIGKFTNAGVKLDKAVDAIKGVANVAAVSGANSNEASRAMYNFSQALSAGSVKLIDWKSIENANMATKEFKDELLKTAVAMGEAKDMGNGMYQILSRNSKGKAFEELVSATQNFNDSLSYRWMTTEVLTETLKHYAKNVDSMTAAEKKAYEEELRRKGFNEQRIKEIEELGRKATKAATEVRTWQKLVESLQEAVGSQWAIIFESIFGDMEQATRLWTAINDVASKVIDNTVGALARMISEWSKLGGRESLLATIANSFKAIGNFLAPIVELIGAFLPKGDGMGRTLAIISAAVERLSQKMVIFSSGVRTLVEAVTKPLGSVVKMVKSIVGLVGRVAGTLLMDLLPEGLVNRLKSIGDFINRMLGKISDGTKKLTDRIDKVTAKIKSISGRQGLDAINRKLNDLTKGKWSKALDTVVKKLSEVHKFIGGKFSDAFKGLTKLMSPVTDAIKSFSIKKFTINLFRDRDIDVAKTASKIFEGILNTIKKIKDAIKSFSFRNMFDGIKNMFSFKSPVVDVQAKATGIDTTELENASKLSQVMEKIKDSFGNIVKGISDMPLLKGIGDAFSKIRDAVTNTEVPKFVKSIQDVTVNAKSTNIFDGLAKSFKSFGKTMGKVFDFPVLRKGIQNFANFLPKSFQSPLAKVKSMFSTLGNTIKKSLSTVGNNIKKSGIFSSIGKTAKNIFNSKNFKNISAMVKDTLKDLTKMKLEPKNFAGVTFLIGGFNTLKTLLTGSKFTAALSGITTLLSGITAAKNRANSAQKEAETLKNTPQAKPMSATSQNGLYQGMNTLVSNTTPMTAAVAALNNADKSLQESAATSGNAYEKLFKTIQKIVKAIKDGFSGIQKNISEFGILGGIIATVFNTLSGALKSIDNTLKLSDAIHILGTLLVVEKVMGVVRRIQGLVRGPSQVQSNPFDFTRLLSAPFAGIAGGLKAIAKSLKLIGIAGILISVKMLADAVKTISEIDTSKLPKAMDNLGLLMLMAAALITFSKDINISLKKHKSFSTSTSISLGLTALAIAVMMKSLAGTVAKLGDLKVDQFRTGLVRLALLSGLFLIFINLTKDLSIITNKMDGIKINTKAASKVGKQMLLLGASFILMTTAVKLFAKIDHKMFVTGSTRLAAFAMGMVGFITAITMINNLSRLPMDIQGTSKAMIKLAEGLLIMYAAVRLFGKLDTQVFNKGATAVAMIGTGVALFVNATSSTDLSKTSKSFTKIATSMVLLGVAMRIIGAMKWENMIKSLVGVGGAMAIMWAYVNTINNRKLKDNAKAMRTLAVSFTIMMVAMKACQSVPVGTIVASMGGFVAIMATLGALTQLKGVGPKKLTNVSLAVMALSASFTAFSMALALMQGVNLGTIVVSVAAFAGVIATFAGTAQTLGVASTNMVTMATSMGILSVAFLGFAVGLRAIEGVSLTTIAVGMGAFVVSMLAAAGIGSICTGAAVGLLALSATFATFGIACSSVAKLISVASTSFDKFNGSAKKINIKPMLDSFTTMINQIASKAPQLVTACANLVIQMAAGIVKNVHRFVQAGTVLILSLISGISNAINKYRGHILGALSGLLGAILGFIVQGVFGLLGKVLSIIPGVGGKLKKACDDIGKKAADGISNGFKDKSLDDDLKKEMAKLQNGIKDSGDKTSKTAEDSGSKIGDGLSKGLTNGVKKLNVGDTMNMFGELNKVINNFDGSPAMRKKAEDMVNALNDGMKKNKGKLPKGAEEMFKELKNKVNKMDTKVTFRKAGNNIVQAMADSIQDKEGKIPANTAKLLKQLDDAMTKKDTSEAGKKKGRKIVEDLTNALKDKNGKVPKSAKELLEAAAKELELNDTSKNKAKESGKGLGDNFSTGIKDSKDKIKQAANDVASSAFDPKSTSGGGAGNIGSILGASFAKGLANSKGVISAAASNASKGAMQALVTNDGGKGAALGAAYALGIRNSSKQTASAGSSIGRAAIGGLLGTDKGKGVALGAAYALGIASKRGSTASSAGALGSAAVGNLKKSDSGKGVALGAAYVLGIKSKSGAAKGAGSAVSSSAVGALKTSDGGKGAKMGSNFASGVRGKTKSASSAGHAVADAASSPLKNLAGKGGTWGSEMVGGFTGALNRAVDKARAAAMKVAKAIASALHFSRPDIGPLRWSDKWMGEMIDGMVMNMNENRYKIKDSSLTLASTIANALDTDDMTYTPTITPVVDMDGINRMQNAINGTNLNGTIRGQLAFAGAGGIQNGGGTNIGNVNVQISVDANSVSPEDLGRLARAEAQNVIIEEVRKIKGK